MSTVDAMVVVLAGPADVAKEVEDVCAGWARAGLAFPMLWVERDPATPVADTTATRLEPATGPLGPVRLLDALARARVRLVRLVSVQLLANGQADLALVEETARLAAMLEEAVSDRQDVEWLNVLVPASDVRDIPPDVVRAPTSKHVLVSPEDRMTDGHTSAGVTYPRNYTTHAALGVTAVSGALVGMSDAPFDGVPLQTSSERPPVVVVRPFARLLRSGSLGGRVMAEVFVRRRFEAWTASAVGAVNAPNPTSVVEAVAQQLEAVENRATSYTPAPAHAMPPKGRMGILAALAMMLRFVIRRLQEAPSQVAIHVARQARQAVEHVAQKATFGQDSIMRVSIGARDHDGGTARPATLQAIDFAAELLRSLGRSLTPPSTAGLWQALRAVAFGLLDAGGFPAGVDPPMDGARRLVLNDPADVVDDGTNRFVLDGSALAVPLPAWARDGVDPWDPKRARDLRDWLTEEQRRLVEGETSDEDPPASAEGPGAQSPAADQAAVDDPGDSQAGDDAAATAGPAASALERALRELDHWAQQRSHTLLWKVGLKLDASLREAAANFADALRTVSAGAPAPDEAARERARRWLRTVLAAGVVVALLSAGAARVLGLPGLAPLAWPVIAAIGLGVWLVTWLVSFVFYQRRMFQLQYELDRRHHRYLGAMLKAEHDASETVRLAALYDQFVDWGAIIALMLHHPEGPSLPDVEADHHEPVPVPNALGVAEGTPSETTIQRASAIVGRTLFGQGWLGQLYGMYRDAAMAGLKHVLGMREDERDFDPDTDLAAPTPREHLLDRLADGSCAARWHEHVRARIGTELAKLSPDELVAHIEVWQPSAGSPEGTEELRPHTFLTELLPDAQQDRLRILPALWVPAARVEASHPPEAVEHVRLWAPSELVTDHSDPRTTVKVAGAGGGGTDVFLRGVVRIDSAKPCVPDDLAVFGPGDQFDGGEARWDDDGVG